MVDNKQENSTNSVHGQETNNTVTPNASASVASGSTDSAVTGQEERPNSITEGSRTITATEKEIDENIYKLDFGVAKSLRYHAKRRRFFETWHNVGMASAVFAATAAFTTVAGQFPEYAKWVAAGLAAVTAFDLIVGFYRRAEAHARLYQRFSALAGEIARLATPSDEDYRRWKVERLRIEADEPPSLNTLNVICHNEEAEARGLGDDQRYYIPGFDRTIAPWVSVRPNYQPISDRATRN